MDKLQPFIFRIMLKKSGSRNPRIELSEMGPSLDLVVRRSKLASDDLYKKALKVSKEAKVSLNLVHLQVNSTNIKRPV